MTRRLQHNILWTVSVGLAAFLLTSLFTSSYNTEQKSNPSLLITSRIDTLSVDSLGHLTIFVKTDTISMKSKLEKEESKIWYNVILNYLKDTFKIQNFIISIIIGFLVLLFREQRETEKEHIQRVDRGLTHMIEHFALSTGAGGKLENILRDMKTKGRVRWLIAKFISEKLRIAFDQGSDDSIVSIKMPSPKEFQDLLEQVIDDCENSIYWTCPYLPYEWFKIASYEQDSLKKPIACLNSDDFKLHSKFAAAKVKKLRIVNIIEEKYQELICSDINHLTKEQISDSLGLLRRFIEINENPSSTLLFYRLPNETLGQHPLRKDIGIYDDEVTIRFDLNTNHVELRMDCYLEIRKMINECLRIDNVRRHDNVKKPQEVIKELKINYRKKLKKPIIIKALIESRKTKEKLRKTTPEIFIKNGGLLV